MIRKGVFGLNDAPRKWWNTASSLLLSLGFVKHRMCLGMFVLYDVVGELAGLIRLHVDDFLGTGN
eukprot:12890664-Prorocentrum_lima.AAC.1